MFMKPRQLFFGVLTSLFLTGVAGAGRHSHPQRDRICCIGLDWWNSAEEQRGKRDEAASAGDGIESAAKDAGKKKKECGLQFQITDVTQATAEPWNSRQDR